MELEMPDLGQLLKEVGPLVGANEIRAQDDAWLISFEEDFGVLVETDEDRRCLVMTAELGRPPAGGELMAYRQLLQVGVNWREMAGLHMALDPADEMVLQIADVSLAGLGLELLRLQIRSFAETGLHCRRVLASFHAEANTSEKFVRV